jgi:hypothetical protein
MDGIARQVVASGSDAAEVANKIVEGLAGPDLRLAFVFADWRLDPAVIASTTHRGLEAPVIGGTTLGVIGKGAPLDGISAVGLGLYGDWLKVGLGVAPDLPKSALTRSRDAVNHAAAALGTTVSALDPSRHVGITLFDGTCGHEEAFCIGSAAAAPQIRFVGGCSATELGTGRRAHIWVNGEVLTDAGVIVVLDSDLPVHPLISSHQVPTEISTVVTAASGRIVYELDGYPAATRLRRLLASIGDEVSEVHPTHSFARYIDGVPYVRSLIGIEGERLHLATAVENGHVLRVMRPGDLIGTTTADLASVAEKVGGSVAAMLLFSCLNRHWDAASRGLERALAGVYSSSPSVGLQSHGEQMGMLLVNHSLTGLAIGRQRAGSP